MTRWGFVADVHGDAPALESALAALERAGAESFVCLGDVLGRGDSHRCLDLLKSVDAACIVGNRDLDWRERFDARVREWIDVLSTRFRASDFIASHGDARLDREVATDDIRRGFRRTVRAMDALGARVAFFGHSHHARIWRATPDLEMLFDGSRSEDGTVFCQPGASYVVNVGTVGLPRAGRGPRSCALYDDSTGSVRVIVLGSTRRDRLSLAT
jgi:predicted phosphodiesterase